MRKHIILLVTLITTLSFAQRSDYSNFSFNVKFEKNISLENVEVYYYEAVNNGFETINYRTNNEINQIELFGTNHFVNGSYFPTIIFSIKDRRKTDYSVEENEVEEIFYLISYHEAYYKGELHNLNFDEEIYFTKEKPNIIVSKERLKANDKLVFKVTSESNLILKFGKINISNAKVKINKL